MSKSTEERQMSKSMKEAEALIKGTMGRMMMDDPVAALKILLDAATTAAIPVLMATNARNGKEPCDPHVFQEVADAMAKDMVQNATNNKHALAAMELVQLRTMMASAGKFDA